LGSKQKTTLENKRNEKRGWWRKRKSGSGKELISLNTINEWGFGVLGEA